MRYTNKKIMHSPILIKVLSFQPSWMLNLMVSRTRNLNIMLEISSACNLRCPLCPVGNKKVSPHLMNWETYKEILDLLPGRIRTITYSNRGEPTLNPHFAKMISYAHEHGFKTAVSTNGMLLDRYIDELVQSGLDTIFICMEGSTSRAHEAYRIGSSFEKVRDNVRLLVEARSRSTLKYPGEIAIQTVISKHNEEQLPDIISMAENLGVDKIIFKTMALNLGGRSLKDQEFLRSLTPNNEGYRRKGKRPLCMQLMSPVILYNGDISVCFSDFEGKHIMGNIIAERSFDKILFNKLYCQTRKKILLKDLPICKGCPATADNLYLHDMSRSFAKENKI